MKKPVSRREVLSIAMVAGAAAALPIRAARATADEPLVSESDPVAVAIGYVTDTNRVDPKANPMYQRGADCANCFWYEPKAGVAAGRCNYFPGKLVEAKAWCQMWHGKAK